jgi:hypothetical protein
LIIFVCATDLRLIPHPRKEKNMPVNQKTPGGINLIRSYYQDMKEIATEGYVKLQVVAVIIDMIAILDHEPTREQLFYIFQDNEVVDTICEIYEITHPTIIEENQLPLPFPRLA